MKKGWIWMIAILAVFAVRTAPAPARAEAAENEGTAEWTVMFYLCGSDLESGHGYATENLKEIMTCKSYAKIWSMTYGEAGDETPDPSPEGVNIVMETGGSKKWHTEDFDIEIATDRLQRWHYKLTEARSSSAWNTLEPEGDLPLASMADPETLADFIRWSAERYPAKKYALVLWDHGGGSKAGIFIDELFDGDTMYLDELRTALTESGVQLEAVLFDACLMANIETAYAIKDGARWMIASEEVVAGEGTAMGVHADLYRVNPETGHTVRLGSTTTRVDLDEEERLRYAFSGFRGWPAIEGVHCDAELVRTEYIGRALYNIPVRLGTEKYLLRCGFEEQAQDPMVIYGLWEGYDADSTVFNRNVISLSKVAGQEYCLLYPIDDPGASGRTAYETSKSMTIFRMLEIKPKRLPAGTYYLDYWVEDIFTRRLPIGRAEVTWDGEKCSTPAGTWQGEAEISPIG